MELDVDLGSGGEKLSPPSPVGDSFLHNSGEVPEEIQELEDVQEEESIIEPYYETDLELESAPPSPLLPSARLCLPLCQVTQAPRFPYIRLLSVRLLLSMLRLLLALFILNLSPFVYLPIYWVFHASVFCIRPSSGAPTYTYSPSGCLRAQHLRKSLRS